jgi:hypothetical protein
VGHCHAGVLLSAKAGPTTCSDDPVLEAESIDLTSDEHAVSAAFMSPCGGDIESNSALEVTVAEGRRDVSSRQLRLLVRSADNRAWRAGPTLLEGLVGVEGVEVAAAHRPTISRICSARALSIQQSRSRCIANRAARRLWARPANSGCCVRHEYRSHHAENGRLPSPQSRSTSAVATYRRVWSTTSRVEFESSWGCSTLMPCPLSVSVMCRAWSSPARRSWAASHAGQVDPLFPT